MENITKVKLYLLLDGNFCCDGSGERCALIEEEEISWRKVSCGRGSEDFTASSPTILSTNEL